MHRGLQFRHRIASRHEVTNTRVQGNGTGRHAHRRNGRVRGRLGRRRLHDRAPPRPVGPGAALDDRHPNACASSSARSRGSPRATSARTRSSRRSDRSPCSRSSSCGWALFAIAFVLMLVTYTHHFGSAISQVGAAMFTLGQARTAAATNDTITTIAGATGLVVIALADRVSPVALRRVQPARGAHDAAHEPGRRAGVGPGDPDPAPARRHHRRAARLLRVVGAVGRRGLRVARELSRSCCCSARPTRGRRGCSACSR